VGFNLIILGTITILVIFFAPKGIVGEFQEKFDFEVFPIRRQ
jgi:ABC-type branched-subunit amino acid transport system permease subunit